MTDNTITEKDDDELIPVETPPEEAEEKAAPAEAEEDDDDQDDERLAQSEDDSEEDVVKADKRVKRRERQKRARDAAQRELQMLRETVAALSQRVSATETHAVNTNVQTLEQRLAKAVADVRQAEAIIAKATEAGNGEDVVAAMRIRDQAIAEAQQLDQAKRQFEQARQQVAAPAAPNPSVVNYAREWMEANPWYDPTGRDRDSALTKAIDNELASEGYNPASREYWEELTARVAEAIGGDDAPTETAKPRRKGPPTGNTREHAPVSTKKEIYVTPERKQAMIEAGVWDDPVLRQRYLKAYQAYDNGSAR